MMPESKMCQAVWKLHQTTSKWLIEYGNRTAPNNTNTVDKILAAAEEIRNLNKLTNRKKGKT